MTIPSNFQELVYSIALADMNSVIRTPATGLLKSNLPGRRQRIWDDMETLMLFQDYGNTIERGQTYTATHSLDAYLMDQYNYVPPLTNAIQDALDDIRNRERI